MSCNGAICCNHISHEIGVYADEILDIQGYICPTLVLFSSRMNPSNSLSLFSVDAKPQMFIEENFKTFKETKQNKTKQKSKQTNQPKTKTKTKTKQKAKQNNKQKKQTKKHNLKTKTKQKINPVTHKKVFVVSDWQHAGFHSLFVTEQNLYIK